jgi:type IV pilus assembly protein PilP
MTEVKSPFALPIDHNDFAQTSTVNPAQECGRNTLQNSAERRADYSLDEVNLKGIVKYEDVVIGVIEIPQQQIITIKVGDYIGRHHGEVVGFSTNGVKIVEAMLNELGCWQPRETQLVMRRNHD